MEGDIQPQHDQLQVQEPVVESVVEPVARIELSEDVVENDDNSFQDTGTVEMVELKDIANQMILMQDTWTSSVMTRLHEMCNDAMLCDMVLVSSDQIKVPCHTPVMVASCAYFNKLLAALNQSYVNAQMTIHLSLNSAVLKQVLAFVYMGKVTVAATDLPQLGQAAAFLDIPILKELCENAEKGIELKEDGFSQMVQEVDIREMVEQHNAENQVSGHQQQSVVLVETEDGQLQVQQQQEEELVQQHSVIIEPQADGTTLEIEDDGDSPIIEGTFEIEGAAEADTAEVLSAISRQGPLSVHLPTQRNANTRSDVGTWEKVFICMYCNRTFRRKDLLQSHERVHTGARPFRCQYCPKAFKQKPHLIEHVRQHTGEKPYHCKVCDRRFAYYSHYNKHRLYHAEGGRKAFVCQYCEKTFLSPLCFAAHEREHRGERPFECSECDQKFTLRNKLIDHQRVEHGMHSAFNCEHCSKRFANASHLREHVRIHTGERPYVCGNCNKGFKTKSTLVKHMETHMQDKPYKCEQCDKSYVRESVLIEHRRTHTGERPYRCQHCDMSFTRQSTLCNHMKIHTTGKQYRCDICSASFVRKDDCIKHVMRRHPSGQRFAHSCDVCHKMFPTRGKVKRHMERKHSNKPGAAESENSTELQLNEEVGEEVVQGAEEAKKSGRQTQYMFTVKKEPLTEGESDEEDSDEEEEEMDTSTLNDQDSLVGGVEETVIIREIAVDSDGIEEETGDEERIVHTIQLKVEQETAE